MGEIPASNEVVLEHWSECEECGIDGYAGKTWYQETERDSGLKFCSQTCINEYLEDRYGSGA